MPRGGSKRRSSIWRMSSEEFQTIVAESDYVGEVVSHFTDVMGGSPWAAVRARIKEEALDTSHFRGIGGKSRRLRISADLVMVENSSYDRSRAKTIFKELKSVPYVCRECGQEPWWRDKLLTLVLDHVNGVNNDHRPSNLRWLCPNCNSQTETFAGRNVGKNKRSCVVELEDTADC